MIDVKTVVRVTGSHPKLEAPSAQPEPDPITGLLAPGRVAAELTKDPTTDLLGKGRGSSIVSESSDLDEPGTDGAA